MNPLKFFRNKERQKNWKLVRDKDFLEQPKNRDIHTKQDLERGTRKRPEKQTKYMVASILFAILFAFIGYIVGYALTYVYDAVKQFNEGVPFTKISPHATGGTFPLLLAGAVGLITWGVIYEKFRAMWKANIAMTDTTDINTYENDQHVMLPEEIQRNYDWFPDAGSHSSVQVSSMLSHMMISKKGIKMINMVQRYEKDVKDKNGRVIHHKGEVILDDEGNPVRKRVPLIDEEFGQELYTASGIPRNEKEIREPYDVRKIDYNPKDSSGNRKDRDKLPYDTVADLINNDWEFPDYEVQRPAGAYIVDTAPVNTMVLAITRAGKGQTVIEPTIDMWTREKRPNNIVVNDPKGELLVKFFIPATVRGYEVVQFNLINPLNTDIYNPLGFAAESAREGDFTKAASYIENIGEIFFPVDGADDPMWPNAANNAFKRSAFGLIDFYLEEEKRLRKEAELKGTPEKVLQQTLDDMWGKVTLYNAYQLFVVLSAKKSSDPDVVCLTEDEQPKEKDFLTLFFDATAKLPMNEMRKLVMNADNALRAMAGSDKTIASVYGIALTAMSFFTDPTISTLTSGKPSQNFDAKSLSFPRRIGVRFSPEYLERHRFVGLQAVWEAYEDPEFKKKLDDKAFGHRQTIDRDGWARYYFDGKFKKRKNYVKLKIVNPKTDLLVKSFYFEVELTYKTDITGRRYVKDPVLNKKIIRDGILREMKFHKKKGKFVYADSTIKRRYRDLLDLDKPEQTMDVPVFIQKSVKYTERPKAIFFITPPHLMKYAKLILILIKQMVDVNFEGSYLTKENQKPLYKTRYMLDEVGNLQSEGNGIPALQTMLSIGLGQDQQFTLILQTLQQLRDVYGDSVDKIIQGNTENIVFLKSTDNSMIDELVKMTGTTHESRIDSKTITKDHERLINKNDARISYTMQTKEVPVISFNDFMFIPPRNSIIIKAGVSPIWNKNKTAYPMSWRLLQNQISIPGKKFSLQTIPTNSSAKDFDVRKNQPDFFKMLERRVKQARLADRMKQAFMRAYGYSENDFIRLDQNVVADDIMDAINREIFGYNMMEQGYTQEQLEKMAAFDDLGMPLDGNATFLEKAEDNVELQQEATKAQSKQSDHQRKRYAGGLISREDLVAMSGAVNRQLDGVLALAYEECYQYFRDDNNFRLDMETGELRSADNRLFVKSLKGSLKEDVETLERAEYEDDARVFGEGSMPEIHFEVTDDFIRYLADLEHWRDLANGRFESSVSKAYSRWYS